MPHQDHNKLQEADPKASLAQNTALGFYQPLPGPGPIRIYVACLASYNAGTLYGRWIDVTSEAEIWDAVQAMLKGSEEDYAEEWAIHDYEGFEGAPVNEYDSFAHVSELAEFIREHGKLGAELVSYFGGHLADARARFENYAGEFISLEDFAHEYTESTGLKIPAQLQNYIDYGAMGRDMELFGDILLIDLGYDVKHIFWAH